ncbi:MAG: haloacid dehalogenase type II [Erythrobacter sp.]|nr:haloacid dehalogenase type II [Erythrobacter sp.]
MGAAALPIPVRAATAPRIKVIAFDGFVIFDPRPVTALAVHHFPEKGAALAAVWSNKLFGYSWLATAAGHYQDFPTLADVSLRYAAQSLGLTLSGEVRRDLLDAYQRLEVWSDVVPALDRLKSAGVRLAFLSNLSEPMLLANMRHAGIARFFDPPLSTDRVQRFKPAPAAYNMAIEAYGLPCEEIGFAAFGGWDAVGATWFGYRTAWINRLGVTPETLGPSPLISSTGIEGVLALAGLG